MNLPLRLDGAEIVPYDLSGRIFVTHLNSPLAGSDQYRVRGGPEEPKAGLTDASSGSNIQYPASLFGLYRCQEELVADGSDAHVMVEVKAVHLALVIGELVA